MSNSTSLKMTTLTPVHVGTGDWLQPEFELLPFPNENCLAVVDTEKVLELVGQDGLNDWVNIIEKEDSLLDWLKTRQKNLQAQDVSERIILVNGKMPTQSSVKAQIRLASPPVACIPGSSLKGSLRTVIFNDKVKHMISFTNDVRNLTNSERKGPSFSDRQINAEIFGRKARENRRKGGYDLDANRDFMRILRFSDFYFPGPTECRTIEIINEYRNGWGTKKEETSFAECIPQGATSTGRFQFPKKLLEQIERPRFQRPEYKTDRIKRNMGYTDLDRLFTLVNDFTETLVAKEITFWEEEDNPSVIGDYLDHLNAIIAHIQHARAEGSCVLRVGAGSGWTFMTGAWLKNAKLVNDDTWYEVREIIQRRDYPHAVPTPKTRKLLENGLPLGFVKLESLK